MGMNYLKSVLKLGNLVNQSCCGGVVEEAGLCDNLKKFSPPRSIEGVKMHQNVCVSI